MGHHSYEDAKKLVIKGLWILAIVTLVEVFFSLLGKGHIWAGILEYRWAFYLISLIIILLSFYKAYYIIYEFMHMRYEVPSLVRTVLLPCALLIWAMIAFFWEGNDWNKRRALIENKNREIAPDKVLTDDSDVFKLNEETNNE